jgi:hypothetical protein
MKKIVVNYSPFVLKQNILLCEEDESVVDAFSVTLDKVNDTVIALCNQYNIFDVYLAGSVSVDYLEKFKAEMKTTFESSSISINIVNK